MKSRVHTKYKTEYRVTNWSPYDEALVQRILSMPIDLIEDSTGLSIVGPDEWAAAKHGKRGKRGCRKLHIGDNGT